MINVDRGIVRDRQPSAEVPDGSIDAWLDVLTTLLRLPDERRDAVRDELSDFLNDRVRDLMVADMSEADAVRHAIGELGDIAGLAQRLNRANRPPVRRWLMSLAWLTIGAGAVATAIVATSPSILTHSWSLVYFKSAGIFIGLSIRKTKVIF